MDLHGIVTELRAMADRLESVPVAGAGDGADPLGGVERAAIAEQVSALIGHDLRNSLSSIRNAAYYLRRRTEGTELWAAEPRMAQFFGLIDESVSISMGVLEKRLVLKHLFARRVGRVAGGACVAQAVACARVAPLRVPDLEVGLGNVEVDPSELALAVRCLIENAVEATEDGRPRVTGHADGAQFVITVTDAGAEIPEDERSLIFDALHTSKPGHAGLGLNIAQRVARRYGGTVSVTSGPAGTRAVLVVPLAKAPGDGSEGT